MSLFGNQSINIKNYPLVLTDGKYSKGTATTRTIKGNFQPFQPDKMLIEQYAGRVEKFCVLRTNESVSINEYIISGNDEYRIIELKNFTNQGLVKKAAFRAIGALEND